MNLLIAMMAVTLAMDSDSAMPIPISEITTEEMCIFASNRMLLIQSRYPEKYKTSTIEVLLQGDGNGE